ncbi:MAG: hypothetical protein CME64_09875 [Halobacteriovoraceae bacterium]|nr:hypothetical protein [Halobacteriovoraceae bacterium]|tara:strand:- start:63759 stop:64133 length:375 start_codon:yes stop_codon:yes gene_type:complete
MRIKNFLYFGLIALFIMPLAHARKPAVEDFVGVETESYAEVPENQQFAFEFGNTVQAEETSGSAWSEWVPTIVLFSFILLPFAMWFGITRGASTSQTTETGNVANLSDYMKDSSEENEEIKKAS